MVLVKAKPLRIACALIGVLLLAAGCSVDPPPVAPEPFGDFAVGEFGGVDGRQNILRVRKDGVALLIAGSPEAGRLSDSDLARLRALLTSEQFRSEVAREAALPKREPTCSDQIITEITMGSLSMSRTGSCGADDLPPAPAFAEILSVVAPARQGHFAVAVGDGAPLLRPVRLQRLPVRNQPGYVITVDHNGRGSITESGEPARSATLTESQQDALRMLEPWLSEGPVPPCNSPEQYRLHIDGGELRPDCSFRGRYPEFRALVAVLEGAFTP